MYMYDMAASFWMRVDAEPLVALLAAAHGCPSVTADCVSKAWLMSRSTHVPTCVVQLLNAMWWHNAPLGAT